MLYLHSLLLLAAVVRSLPTDPLLDSGVAEISYEGLTDAPSDGEDMIPVPGKGWMPTSSVYVIPDGGELFDAGDEIHVLDSAGEVVHVVPNLDPTPIGDPAPSEPSQNISARTAQIAGGWITTAVWDGSPSQVISSSKATWTVPAAPVTRHQQLLYYFNGIGADGVIFQPVLRYWFDGWTVASWLVGPTGVFVTNSIPVKVGQVLTGVMTQTKKSSTSYALTSSFSGISGATLSTTYKKPMYIAWASAFEQYAARTHSLDYPASAITFSNIDLKFMGTAPTVNYRVINYNSRYGTTSITTNGGSGAKTVIHPMPAPFRLMTYCTNANFTGACDTVTYPSAANVPALNDPIQCLNIDGLFPAGVTFKNTISSAKILPSGSDYACYLYRNAYCVKPRLRIDTTYNDLRTVAFNDISLSWSCNKK